MKQTQQGFTLIELVMVIVILGILAATALPRYINLERDARIAVVNGMEASLRTSALLAHSRAILAACNQAAANQNCDINGDGVNELIDFGYPDDGGNSMDAMLQDLGNFTPVTAGGQREYRLNNVNGCEAQYNAPAAAGGQPTFAVDTTNC